MLTYDKILIVLSPDSSGQLYVFWHYCHVLGVNSSQISVLEQTDEIIFAGRLEGVSCFSCKISFKVLGNLPDQM